MKKFLAMIKYLFFPFFSTAAAHTDLPQMCMAPQAEIRVETKVMNNQETRLQTGVMNICDYPMHFEIQNNK